MADQWLEYLSDPDPWRAPDPLPRPVLTERLIVRPYEKGDGPKLFGAIAADRASLLPWMAWAVTDHQDLDDSIFYIEQCRRKMAKAGCADFPLGVFDRATGELVGGSGLHRVAPGRREAEVGYWIRGDRHGRGLCTEATGHLISSALTAQSAGGWGFRRIVIYNHAENVGSRRVCEKLGLRLELRSRKERYLGLAGPSGAVGYHDMFGFAVLADEWDFEQHRAKPGIGW